MNTGIQKSARLAVLLALAVTIHTLEAMLPVTILWMRFGFSNIITVAVLYLCGVRDAAFITIGRVMLGSLTSGTFGSPAFVLSFSGGLSAFVVMSAAYRTTKGLLSPVGVSILGAVAHNLGQLGAAYLILIQSKGILALLPFMFFAAAGTGLINGLAARLLINKLESITHEPATPCANGH